MMLNYSLACRMYSWKVSTHFFLQSVLAVSVPLDLIRAVSDCFSGLIGAIGVCVSGNPEVAGNEWVWALSGTDRFKGPMGGWSSLPTGAFPSDCLLSCN